MNHAEFKPMDPALEQAVTEIRDDAVDAAVIEAAAARVWARLSAAAKQAADHIRGCADFQALIPEYRAGRLPEARATLLKDHLHECVACRQVYEGRVVAMPRSAPARRVNYSVRWAAAAAVVAAAGLSVWFAVDQYGGHTGRAIVQAVNGTCMRSPPTGIRSAGGRAGSAGRRRNPHRQGFRRHAATRDGSMVELRERSGFSTSQAASDLTIRLSRGSIIVQAAKRRTGHLYVATADCQRGGYRNRVQRQLPA